MAAEAPDISPSRPPPRPPRGRSISAAPAGDDGAPWVEFLRKLHDAWPIVAVGLLAPDLEVFRDLPRTGTVWDERRRRYVQFDWTRWGPETIALAAALLGTLLFNREDGRRAHAAGGRLVGERSHQIDPRVRAPVPERR